MPRLAAPVAAVMVPQGGAVMLADDVITLHDPQDPDLEEFVLEVQELPFAGTLQQQVYIGIRDFSRPTRTLLYEQYSKYLM